MIPSKTPMPGAVTGVTRLPFDDIVQSGKTLSASDAINFTNVTLASIPSGTTLYRVYGGPAGMNGSYWSLAAPTPGETEADWRGQTAVELSWNSGISVAKLVTINEMSAWVGGVAPQPAEDTNCNYLPGYLLPGGGQQYKRLS